MDVRTIKDLEEKISSEKLLFSLIEESDEANLQILIEKVDSKPSFNIKNKLGITPLMVASRIGDLAIMKRLIDANADVNGKSSKDLTTPIFFACYSLNPTGVQLLIDSKADIEARDKSLNTPLMVASAEKSYSLAKVLVDAKAAVNSINYSNSTALIKAANKKQSKIVKLLLDRNANPDIQEKTKGMTALMAAAEKEDSSVIKLLLDAKASATLRNSYGYKAAEFTDNSHCKKIFKSAEKAIKDREKMPGIFDKFFGKDKAKKEFKNEDLLLKENKAGI